MKILAIPSSDDLHATFTYDHATGLLYWKHRRDVPSCVNTRLAGKQAGLFQHGYYKIYLNGRYYLGHRLIWAMFNEEIPSGMCIDHIDGNPSNNRLNNLRLATFANNNQNRKRQKKDRGVERVYRRFRARIMANGVRYDLGFYATREAAQAAYDAKANELHGQFFERRRKHVINGR